MPCILPGIKIAINIDIRRGKSTNKLYFRNTEFRNTLTFLYIVIERLILTAFFKFD